MEKDKLFHITTKKKEVKIMPGFDGTGPMGKGPGFGWGNGQCRNVKQSGEMPPIPWQGSDSRRGRSGFGGGMGMRRRGCGQMNSEYNCDITEGDRSFLEEQKSHLENRLNSIRMRLEELTSAKPDKAEDK
ncbi:MAG: DUF5320 domain-containing protein [Desulfamplus sp.]|nr:DUF5320 domain-containing protein [Desulfamplus sp.]